MGVLQGIFSFDSLIGNFATNNADETLVNYARLIRPKIKELFPENNTDHTTIINGTIFVSKDQNAIKGYSTVFKKILLRFKDYGSLKHIDYDFKSQLFESFLKESISKKNWGQFFTPLKVVRAIANMAKNDIKPGSSICDPACGVGKFLLEPILDRLDQFFPIENGKIVPNITIHGFDKGFDKDEQKTIILAKANMLIYFSDLICNNAGLTNDFSDLFNKSFTLKTNSILGTLSEPLENEYDLILTNPPYVTSGSSNLKDEIKKDAQLTNYYKVSGMGVEGLFMEWIIKALKPGGKAYVVVLDGLLNRQNDKKMRQYILDECILDALISLPLHTFFTTSKKTYILGITKKMDKKQVQSDAVFTYLVSEIGESRDVYRFDIEQDDLTEAVTLFAFFKASKERFKDLPILDKRCKIVSIDYFVNGVNKNWVIDKQWSEKERIELGILEEHKTTTLFEFSTLIEEMKDTFSTSQADLQGSIEKKKPNVKYKACKLSELFEILGEDNLTKTYINSNKGTFPVYSGQIENGGIFGFIKTYKYDETILTWVTYGNSGHILKREGKFNIGRNNCGLRPLTKLINLDYVKHIAEPIFIQHVKGMKQKSLPQSIVKDIEINIPTTKTGEFCLATQQAIVQKHQKTANIQAKISAELTTIAQASVVI